MEGTFKSFSSKGERIRVTDIHERKTGLLIFLPDLESVRTRETCALSRECVFYDWNARTCVQRE